MDAVVGDVVPSVVCLTAQFRAGVFAGRDVDGDARDTLLDLSIPCLPYVGLTGLLGGPHVGFVLSTGDNGCGGRLSAVLSRTKHAFGGRLAVCIAGSTRGRLYHIGTFFYIATMMIDTSFRDMILYGGHATSGCYAFT